MLPRDQAKGRNEKAHWVTWAAWEAVANHSSELSGQTEVQVCLAWLTHQNPYMLFWTHPAASPGNSGLWKADSHQYPGEILACTEYLESKLVDEEPQIPECEPCGRTWSRSCTWGLRAATLTNCSEHDPGLRGCTAAWLHSAPQPVPRSALAALYNHVQLDSICPFLLPLPVASRLGHAGCCLQPLLRVMQPQAPEH